MQITTKFEIGHRVTDGKITGEITTIQFDSSSIPYYQVKLDLPSGSSSIWHWIPEPDLWEAPKPMLTEEEAWLEAALLIGRLVEEFGNPLWETESKEIRHRAYQVLGGNGVKVNDDVKVRVRSLIQRTINQYAAA